MMTVTVIKTQDAQPMGIYNPTAIDEEKRTVDFRLMQVGPYYIRWEDGRGEIVTERRLRKLQKEHTWTTDF